MIVSNLLFDVILFGVLLIAAIVDRVLPQLAGAVSVVAVGAATYMAAQEWSDALQKRRAWTQEALSTAVALSVLGFIYFWWRNQSDLVLLVLSIGLMMASLMVAIATIAACGSAIKELSAAPIGGWLLTLLGALSLGVLGGVLALFLGGGATLFAKVLVLGISLFIWKIREALRPPAANAHTPVQSGAARESDAALLSSQAQNWFLIPRRGTLLDRFVPVLVLGALLFLAAQQIKSPDLWTPTPPAVADNGNPANDNVAP
jgi:hypothetical protein